MPLLFSYGSNSPTQLGERLDRRVRGEPASTVGWQRAFRGHSRTWGGGVATLIPKPGKITYGYVEQVTPAELRILDRYEGVPQAYRRETIDVILASGDNETHQAVVYLSNSKTHEAPTRAYLEACARTVGAFWNDGHVKWSDFPVV